MQKERSGLRKEGLAGDVSTSRKQGAPSLWSLMSHHRTPLRKEGGLMEGPRLPHYDDALVIRAWRRAVCLAQCITSVLESSLA